MNRLMSYLVVLVVFVVRILSLEEVGRDGDVKPKYPP